MPPPLGGLEIMRRGIGAQRSREQCGTPSVSLARPKQRFESRWGRHILYHRPRVAVAQLVDEEAAISSRWRGGSFVRISTFPRAATRRR
jgi:hypothetical protein